jgi:uncharacterized protein (DUF305 family)
MNTTRRRLHAHFGILPVLLALTFPTFVQSNTPIIQPGAPGQPARELTADEAIAVANTNYSPDDVRFMPDMIPHHHQALMMSALVADRTNRPELIDVSGRIDASQSDEIDFMQKWLRDRSEPIPDPMTHDAMHTSLKMAGMATPEQMKELAAVQGIEFDRLFLQLMITHHEGAITMVEELLENSGSAHDPVLFEFTTDITNEQKAEIERMLELMASLYDDPRASLSSGYDDSGQASLHMELIASVPKPPGFFDPANPIGLPPERLTKDAAGEEAEKAEKTIAGAAEDSLEVEEHGDDEDKRWPLLGFANTDMAFAGDVLVVGNYHGFNIYRMTAAGEPQHVSSVVCPGGQGDLSIVGDLLLMSVEETRGRLDCGLEGVSEDVSADRFRGVRILDISDLTRPIQVGAVQTCRGSHTHTVVSQDDKGKIIVYNSGISSIREEEELEGCFDDTPGDDRTALFRIDVLEIPVDRPDEARIVASPTIFADPDSGRPAGLWRGGDHGDETQDTERTDHCHDITVFPERGIAAGACSGNGILFDISDPLQPKRIDEVIDTGFAYWHSATFNNDGTKVIFTDEWGGGMRPRCRAHDPLEWGANAIYDIVDGKLEFRSYYKMPAPQLHVENCVAHNGSIVPVPGRDIFVQAWYQGGISMIDFTDSAQPTEIAYFDRGPIDAEDLILGGFWSTYYYNGRIYGTEIARGLDVFSLLPSEHMSESEIAAASMAHIGDVFNPQQQFSANWPSVPTVAQSYLDQLDRKGALPDSTINEIRAALDRSTTILEVSDGDDDLADRLEEFASVLMDESTGEIPVGDRRIALAETLTAIASALRDL